MKKVITEIQTLTQNDKELSRSSEGQGHKSYMVVKGS